MKPDSSAVKKVAGVVLLRKDGAMLMQHRDQKPGLPYAGKWSIPSGRQEPGETPEECARRELLEETGYRSGPLEPLMVVSDREDTGSEYILTIFWACYDGLQLLKCHEGQDLQFVERSSAAAYPTPPFIIGVWDKALKNIKL